MGTKYSTELVGGVVATYNDSPPTDDGSQTEANRVKYATVTGDLTAPLHSAIIGIDTKLVNHFDMAPNAKATTYETVADDYGRTIECTGTFTLSLLAESTAGAGYWLRVKNAGSGTITVAVAGGGTIDGAANATLVAGDSSVYQVNDAENDYMALIPTLEFVANDTLVMYQDTKTGWTLQTALNEHAIALVSSGAGATAGTNNFTAQFTSINSGGTALSKAQLPAVGLTVPGGAKWGSTTAGGGFASGANLSAEQITTENMGSGQTHLHTVDLAVKYAKCAVFKKD